MKKKLTFLSVAFMAVAAFAASVTWKASADTPVTAGTELINDDALTVKTVYATTLKQSKQTFGEQEFTHYVQVRNGAYPTESSVYGTEQSGSTSLIFTPKKNLTVTIYYNRQSTSKTEGAYAEGDGKDLIFYQNGTKLAGTLTKVKDNNSTSVKDNVETVQYYALCTKTIALESGKEYVLSAKGTTGQFYGVTYEYEDAVAAATYTVAGNNTDLFGTAWDPANTANDMTLSEGVYSWSKTDVTLPANSVVEFKVCEDHAWQNAYPNTNYQLNIAESGIYTISITFDPDTKAVNATATKTGNAEVTVDYFLVGSFNSWTQKDENYKLVKNEEAEVEEYSITLDLEAGTEYKVISSTSTWYPGGTDNMSVAAAGNYTIYFRPVANEAWGGNIYAQANSIVTPATDIKISLDDGADIATKLAEAEKGVENIGNISINLAEGGNYTIYRPLTAYKNFEIQGNGATIDASELEGNFIEMAATAEVPTEAVQIENVSIHNATVKGLKKALFYSTQKQYLINWLTIDNCVIEQAADATTIDFTKGSAARSFNIENSTIYAPTATTKVFYSSQGGQKLTELDEEGIQTFIVKNSTMYNLAKGKNFFSHRQSNQKWLAYDLENSLFVNCGKSGQAIKGLNGGGSSANPTWTITGNAFNFEAEGVMTDTSAAEDTGDTTEGEGVQNSVAGIVTFTDAAAGNFGGVFDIGDGKAPEALGDPRWKLTFKTIPVPSGTYYVVNANAGSVVNVEGAIDANGAPITFTYDAATKTYTISGAEFFAEKQWTVANQSEDMPGYFVITTVVDGVTKYLTVDAYAQLALADAADDYATWIVLEKAYWEDIANSTYTVAGTKNLTGTDEDWLIAEANQMKYNEETKLFEITYNNITVTNDVKPEFKVVKTNMNNEQSWYPEGDNSNWVITPEVLAGEGEYDITITFDPSDSKEIKVTGLKIEDITIRPESGADIFEALIAAEMNVKPRNISISLAEGGNYTITGPLTAYANFEIQGNGATIDASGLSNNFIQMAATAEVPAEAVHIENVSIHNATVKGLKKALFYSTQKGYLINWLTIDNSVIEQAADATTIDFTKGSAARSFNIENSTIYAPTKTTQSFYSSQGGQKLTELDAEGIQTFIVKNSTMYNLAVGKNFFSHRQSNQKWLAYDVENSLFVNCGKSGQVIKGMNGGQSGTNPTWTITGNAFNFEAEGVMTDTSAAEDTGDTTEGEGVQNSVAGVVTFTDAAAGDFSGVMTVADGSVMLRIGDPRWFMKYNYPDEPLANPEKLYIIGDITPNGWAKTGLAEMNYDETTQTFTYEFETTLSRACFAIADVAEFTDWADFNFYHRYAYEQQGGDQKAKFNEATQLTKTKGDGTIELSAGKYTISISKADGKMTITGEAATYTVAGAFSVDGVEEESFLGTKWDPTLTANDMTMLPDYTYQKVYTGVKFEKAGTILFKVCKNHAWTVCYGDGEGNNATCTVSEPCTATVTFTFNPYAEGQKVSCELSEVVGISSVKTVDLNDAPVFNLNGQRVNKAQKGLFIVGGKKVVRK